MVAEGDLIADFHHHEDAQGLLKHSAAETGV